MKQYRAIRDSFSGRFYYGGKKYWFDDEPPSQHFELIGGDSPTTKNPVADVDEKRELFDQAESLGIKVDKRWGLNKLREAVAVQED